MLLLVAYPSHPAGNWEKEILNSHTSCIVSYNNIVDYIK